MEGKKGEGMPLKSMGSGMVGLGLDKTPLHQHRTQHLLPFTATTSQRQEAAAAAALVVDGHYSPQQQQQQQQQQRISQPVIASSSPSPWQRMKWTANMVRLLIMIVFCVGDDANNNSTAAGTQDQHQQPAGINNGSSNSHSNSYNKNKKTSGNITSKGKWKSVSRAMMEKGFYVSPQQCEDKFNDLNKRYKRVNELLGKGTACLVVEDHSLLDSLNHLTPKAKEEARKLLNSKHLFFREMCAYHNSTNSTSTGAPPPQAIISCTAAAATAAARLPQPPQSSSQSLSLQQQQHCFHHPPPDDDALMFAEKLGRRHSSGSHDINDTDGDDDEDEDSEEEDDDEDEYHADDYEDQEDQDQDHEQDSAVDHKEHKKSSTSSKHLQQQDLEKITAASPSPPLSLSPSPKAMATEQLKGDLLASLATVPGGEQQQRQWLKRKAAELEEQRLGYQCRAVELEKQRFKWLRFSTNKEREMKRMKLTNERLCLENDRMLLLLRQKERELILNNN